MSKTVRLTLADIKAQPSTPFARFLLAEAARCIDCGAAPDQSFSPCQGCQDAGRAGDTFLVPERKWKDFLYTAACVRETNRYRSRIRDNHERRAPGFHTGEDKAAILDLQQWQCHFCGNALSHGRYEWDHLTPLSAGGSAWPGNMAAVCTGCNADKHNRSDKQYWALLGKRHGRNWIQERRAAARTWTAAKRKLTKQRQRTLSALLSMFELFLCDELTTRLGKQGLDPAFGRMVRLGKDTDDLTDHLLISAGEGVTIALEPGYQRRLSSWLSNGAGGFADVIEALRRQAYPRRRRPAYALPEETLERLHRLSNG